MMRVYGSRLSYYTGKLGFELIEDTALSAGKRWVLVAPRGDGGTRLLLAKVLKTLEGIREDFNDDQSGDKRVSLADVIVLGGAAAIEKAAGDAGFDVTVPFMPGRNDTTQEMTDVRSFAALKPTADGLRNYYSDRSYRSPTAMLVDKADLLTLTASEMTALVGGMRALNALNIAPTVFHMNEGHSALLVLELLRRYAYPPEDIRPGESPARCG